MLVSVFRSITFAVLFCLLHFHNLSFALKQYEVYTCSHYYVINTFMPIFLDLCYPDEIAVQGRTNRKDCLWVFVYSLSLISFSWLLYYFCLFPSNNRQQYCVFWFVLGLFYVVLQKYLKSLNGKTGCSFLLINT